MALLNTDYFSINRAGTPGTGGSGTYYVSQLSDLLAYMSSNLSASLVSADAGNALVVGTDGKLLVKNAVVAQSAATGDITLTDNLGADTTVEVNRWMAGATAP